MLFIQTKVNLLQAQVTLTSRAYFISEKCNVPDGIRSRDLSQSLSARVHGFQSLLIRIHGFQSLSVRVHGYQSLLIRVHGFQSLSVRVHGFLSLSARVH